MYQAQFDRFEKKVWLSSPTMHGEELEYIKEAFETNWMSTMGKNIDEIERILPYIKEDSTWRFKKFKKKIKHVDAFFDRAYNLLSHEEYELLETAQRKVKNACFINEKT